MTYGIYINSSMVLCTLHMIMAKLAGGKADPGDLISPEIFCFLCPNSSPPLYLCHVPLSVF